MRFSKFFTPPKSEEARQKAAFFNDICAGNVAGVRDCVARNPEALTWRTDHFFSAPKTGLEVALREGQKEVFDTLLRLKASPNEICYVGFSEGEYSVTELTAIKGKPDFLRSALDAGGRADNSLLDQVPKNVREEIRPLLEESTRRHEKIAAKTRAAYAGSPAKPQKSHRMSQTGKNTLGSNLF